MATVRARGTGFEVQVRRVGVPQYTRSFQKFRDAKAFASQLESEMDQGLVHDRRRVESTLVDDLLERYAREVTPLKKGATVELARIRALRRRPIARYSIGRFNREAAATYRDDRLLQVSGSAVNRELNLLGAVFTTARKDWGYEFANPIHQIRRPRENRPRRRRLRPLEEAALLAELKPSVRLPDGTYAPGGVRNPYVAPLVLLALETAMRRGELLALRWGDVFLDEQYVQIRDSKNGDARDVPLSSRAVAILESLARLSDDDRVFPTSAEAVKQCFVRAVERAGIHDLHFHDLRHEATTRLASRLGNVLERVSVTGHKTLKMAQRYFHPDASSLARKLG